ncbi:FAD binding domain-containing protein [Pseudoduganella umbonata]|uniref:Xanthine dehydrogenase YagS FAD-binding subunit n=1 Tax=Pseudoduganella umbonata TaxID=864828 RepID=A0A4P8HLA5_9BURK|nr:xanthine dehydrogenase family protein subunit M [Pseudoduganella umbonata]MBB3219632.1 xanthine dehydrogenase YagS FAD-binding subunit [Pseudoduganella umbonata]QCP09696.1 xanthine dehydrogenase family protein subunit M [Pseudoduganella umbonata]
MRPFELRRAASVEDAVLLGASSPTAQHGASVRYLAGGTTLLDLMKLDVEHPAHVVQIAHLGLDRIEVSPDGGLSIGATVRNSDLAHDERVRLGYPVLSEGLLSGASGQLRNMATTAGNLLQRTRCVYFRDPDRACNKRAPGSGCDAMEGYHRNLALLGTSDHCIATNPSDMNVALVVLEARIHIAGLHGRREIPIANFHLLPRETPHIETPLAPGDLVTHVTLPPLPPGTRSGYLKLRDRASYEFALASCAVVLRTEGGIVEQIRIGLGGVATRPWRAVRAEHMLAGRPLTVAGVEAAAAAALEGAQPRPGNAFKVELARRCIVQAIRNVAGEALQ